MPNWCANSVVLKHKDPTFIARARAAAEKDGLLNEFIPVPKDLKETIAGSFGDTEEQKQLEIQEAYNIKNYGYSNWYDFCVNEWGTKWDVTGEVQDIEDGLMLTFDSAWAPPHAPTRCYLRSDSSSLHHRSILLQTHILARSSWLQSQSPCS